MSKITDYTALTSVDDADVLVIVDVDDTSMSSAGTTKKIAVSDLLSGVATATALAAETSRAEDAEGANASAISEETTRAQVAEAGRVLTSSVGAANGVASLGSTGAVPLSQGGSGKTTLQASMNAFAGATTAGQYLRGNGTNVVMSAIQAADLPAGSGLQAWQFLPETYGAKGDGKVLGDVVTNSTTTITSATATFTSSDVGKHIMIHGANGAANGPLITTIASFTNSTTVVLAAAATASVSNCPAVYGTDDTAAVNSAVSAAGTYALANDYFAEVIFGAKAYILASGPTQTGNGSTTPTFNAQIPLPYPAANGTSRKLVIQMTGAGDAGYCQYWGSLVPNVAGSALVSMVTASSTPNATFGQQSVIGGPSGSVGFASIAGNTPYANVKAVIRGLSVWLPIWTNIYAYDFGFVSAMRAQQSSAHIFAPPGANTSAVQPYLSNIVSTVFKNSVGTGFRTPVNGNNDDVTMDDVTVEGYECAYRAFDHFTAGRIAAINSDVVMFFNSTQGASSTSHGIFARVSAENYNGGLLTNGGTVHVNLDWDAEVASPSYDISDASNALHGIVRFRDPANARFPTVSGAGKLKIICEELGPGYWSGAPAAPASGVSQQNTAWRPARVTVTSTAAITAFAVDGNALFTGSVSTGNPVYIDVPPGHSYSVTSSGGTLTTKWDLG